ncbi:chondroadherin [Latimeria chalumnae]|uniref:Fibronectin type-III domain-containing protein n=1 Tax=Latimeria chalumnae TaxID=7897 RepID=M3XLD3_LATCH|nr:PREDICTED: chondroadherin-like [Latimeria chalumnae]|eukprot:XP_006002027.1 PREDICTED: chondroadherin-like [Latimeria chalumnae]
MVHRRLLLLLLLLPLLWGLILALGDSCPAQCTCTYLQAHVDCAGMNLAAIPPNIPGNATVVYLSNNSFPTVAAGSFTDLSNLTALHLSSCHVSKIQGAAFAGLPSLQHVHLDHNNIEELGSDVFENATSLRYLYLDHNKITQLNPGTFTSLTSLNALYLNSNLLTQLAPLTFKGLGRVRLLDLSHNHIFNISSLVFTSLRSIRNVHLQGNNLTNVPKSLRYRRSLSVLNLSENPIRELTHNSFGSRLRSLLELYIDNTGLEQIAPSTFFKFRQLKVLSLRDNRLQSLPPLKALRYLKEVILAGNPWRCDCNLLWLHAWYKQQPTINVDHQANCSTPAALEGQPLAKVQLQKLSCPPYNPNTPTTQPPQQLSSHDQVQPTKGVSRLTTRKATTTTTTKATTTTKKQVRTVHSPVDNKQDPCLSDQVYGVAASAKDDGSLTVTWSFFGDYSQFEVRYSHDDTVQVSRTTGGVTEAELGNLVTNALYRICIVPQKYATKCLKPVDRQCTEKLMEGSSGESPQEHSSGSGLGIGITAAVMLLAVLGLVAFRKLKDRAFRFQRHYDEDGLDGAEQFGGDAPKLDTDPVYENIADGTQDYGSLPSETPKTEENKVSLKWGLDTMANIPSTPRYVNIRDSLL